MHGSNKRFAAKLLAWLLMPVRLFPGLFALVAVLFLLGGEPDTTTAVKRQVYQFANSFVGDGENEISDVLRKTAPLALSIGIISLAAFRRWIAFTWPGILTGAAVIVSVAWFSNQLSGGPPIEPPHLWPERSGLTGLILLATGQIIGYIQHYEPRLFFASLVVGLFFGWKVHCQLRELGDWLGRQEMLPAALRPDIPADEARTVAAAAPTAPRPPRERAA